MCGDLSPGTVQLLDDLGKAKPGESKPIPLPAHKPSRYPVRVVGGALPARGIAERDILVVDCALDRAPDRVCVAMAGGEFFLAVLQRRGLGWLLIRSAGNPVEVTEDTEVWGIVTSIVRQAV
jgi:SOS-response transcriptional repressor LexA